MRISDWSSDVCSSDLIGGDQSVAGRPPAFAAVRRLPHAAAGNGNCDPPAVARVQRYGMDARLVIAAAEPLRTARLVPQCAVQRPALAAVLAADRKSVVLGKSV